MQLAVSSNHQLNCTQYQNYESGSQNIVSKSNIIVCNTRAYEIKNCKFQFLQDPEQGGMNKKMSYI